MDCWGYMEVAHTVKEPVRQTAASALHWEVLQSPVRIDSPLAVLFLDSKNLELLLRGFKIHIQQTFARGTT